MDELRGAKTSSMAQRAAEVLRRNDMGGWTKPAPVELGHRLYSGGASAPRHCPRCEGATQPLRAPVEERQGATHSLQPAGPAGELLPRRRALVERGGIP